MSGTRVTLRALALGDRIDTSGLERPDMISAAPLAFRVGAAGYVALFRFGVAVLAGLSPVDEDDILRGLATRVSGGRGKTDDEIVILEISAAAEDAIAPGGPIQVRELDAGRFLVLAEAIAKSVALAREEREVNSVFDLVEPFARDLAARGRAPTSRREMLALVGKALLVQHRVSGRVAATERPDILWDRPDLERLHARLEDEYELEERGAALDRKLGVIIETSRALTDILDANRSTRLEMTIVVLIVIEVLISFYELFWRAR